MPKIRIAGGCAHFVVGEDSGKLQSRALSQRPKNGGRYQEHLVTAPAQGNSEADIGMNVACAT
jgi:hypothetical protein